MIMQMLLGGGERAVVLSIGYTTNTASPPSGFAAPAIGNGYTSAGMTVPANYSSVEFFLGENGVHQYYNLTPSQAAALGLTAGTAFVVQLFNQYSGLNQANLYTPTTSGTLLMRTDLSANQVSQAGIDTSFIPDPCDNTHGWVMARFFA